MSRTPEDISPHVVPRVYLTEDIAPLGGQLKQRPEDFIVEELPLFTPSGQGEHIYLLVEKIGVPAMDMMRVIARHFGVPQGRLGYAGLKDRQAITRQVVSVHVPGKKIEQYPSLDHPDIRILWTDYHDKKLRRGNLKGNRFSIRLRGVPPTAVVTAKRVLERLQATGVPDGFGEQRFGYLINNHLIGRALILREYHRAIQLLLSPNDLAPRNQSRAREAFAEGDYGGALGAFPKRFRTERLVCEALSQGQSAEQAFEGIDNSVLGYYVSAFQSAIFNRVLDERVASGTLGAFVAGDVAIFHDNQSVFDVDEVTLNEQSTIDRLREFDISPSGPMWGATMKRAGGGVGENELAALHSFGVDLEDLERATDIDVEMIGGTRRPLRVPVRNVEVEGGVDEHGSYVRCAFDLPRG
ncbi:MAG: tRNA pseudouridine(13) synthase TruD, partial [Planctomycetota bacterium]